jgi:hypothetical protein
MLHYLAVWDFKNNDGKILYEVKKTISVELEIEVPKKLREVENNHKPSLAEPYYLMFRTLIKL